MPIDASQVKWDAPDPKAVVWDAPAGKPSFMQSMGREALNSIPVQALFGAARGIGGIGATVGMQGEEGRKAVENKLVGMGADPESLSYKGGKLASEVGVTWPFGGLLAKGFAAIPGATSAVPSLINALRTGGMTTGATPANFLSKAGLADMAIRTGAGAAVGGASAGMIDPSQAGMGAAIGGAAPPVFKVLGAAGELSGKALFNMLMPAMQQKAVDLAKTTGNSLDEIVSALRQQNPSLIPGSEKTVPEILQNRDISQIARTLKSSGQNALGEREAANNAARVAALERVAPTAGTINEARSNLGNAVEASVRPAQQAATENVRQLFQNPALNRSTVNLPLDKMNRIADTLVGPGYIGKGKNTVESILGEAENLGTQRVPGAPVEYSSSDIATRGRNGFSTTQTAPRAVPFDEISRLRSSITDAINEAEKLGRGNAKAALVQMKNEIDNKIGAVASGERMAGEMFTPEAVDAYGQALAAHGAKKAQFHTGPQAAIFRKGSDGLPAKEGAEVAPLFWNSGNAQIENMQAFKRLTGEDQNLVKLMKSNATTEAMQSSARGPLGEITFDKFNKWMQNHSGAAKELFTSQELATLKAIQDETRNSAAAAGLGAAKGSPTFQNFFSNGMLDNKGLGLVANKIPGGNMALNALKNASEKSRNNMLSELLANPELMASQLQGFSGRQANQGNNQLMQLLQSPEAQQLMYRMAPISQ